MKALTVRQPWAGLIAYRLKWIETRPWRTHYRGWIAIHAGLANPIAEIPGCGHGIVDMLGDLVWMLDEPHEDPDDGDLCGFPLVRGAVIATARLVNCVPIVDDGTARNCVDYRTNRPSAGAAYRYDDEHGNEEVVDARDQIALGDFTPGRWAWILDDIAPTQVRCPVCLGQHPDGLPIVQTGFYRGLEACQPCRGMGHRDPMPATGRLGLWDWDPASAA